MFAQQYWGALQTRSLHGTPFGTRGGGVASGPASTVTGVVVPGVVGVVVGVEVGVPAALPSAPSVVALLFAPSWSNEGKRQPTSTQPKSDAPAMRVFVTRSV